MPCCGVKNPCFLIFFDIIIDNDSKGNINMETMEKLQKNGIFLDYKDIIPLCKKYGIIELSIFGSSIRDDFTQNSDVDLLVSFDRNSNVTLFDIMDLESEFSKLVKKEVDIVEKEALKNPIRRNKILSTREIIYAA
jgi:predicted nucleotidyltransferase